MKESSKKRSSKKNCRVELRLTDKEYNYLKFQSKKLKTSMTRIITSSFMGVSLSPIVNRELIAELKRIGVNLNQISASFNSNPNSLNSLKIANSLEKNLNDLSKILNKLYNL